MDDKKVVGLEYTPAQLAAYRLHVRALEVDTVSDSKFMGKVWGPLLALQGPEAVERFIKFIEATEDVFLVLDIIGREVGPNGLDRVRNVSQEIIRNGLLAISGLVCSPEKLIKDICEDMVPSFSRWPYRAKVRSLFLGLLVKEMFGFPYTFKTIRTTEKNDIINKLGSVVVGALLVPDNLCVDRVPGVDYLLRVHTLLGLFAKMLKGNDKYISTPLTVPCAKGYALNMLRLLKDLNRTDEELRTENMAELVASGWTYGEEFDHENKVGPTIVPYDRLPETIKARDRLFRAITLTFVGLGDHIQS
jgi:hypothetical protein